MFGGQTGLSMMLSGLGIDPKEIKEQIEKVVGDVHTAQVELARQGALLNEIREDQKRILAILTKGNENG